MKIPDSLLGPGFLAMSLHLLIALKTLNSSALHILVDALRQGCARARSIAACESHATVMLCRPQVLLTVETLGREDLSIVLCSVRKAGMRTGRLSYHITLYRAQGKA